MPYKTILDSTEATTGGILTLGTGLAVNIYEWVTLENVNNLFEFALAVGGGLFLWYKIKGQKLDNESKRLDNDRKRKENS
jgi:hypothetical protein